ncbi:MAG: hypothetical protein E7329_08175 [Clostridiales bacterium]|nr:hypothetical protein [Clostridiales bacterium]
MIDVKPDILAALSHLPAYVKVDYDREEVPLPVITVGDESSRVLSQADGKAYLEEYTAAVDIYAGELAEMEALFLETDAALSALGLRRTYQQDLYDEQACAFRKCLRYRGVLCGNIIYQ